MNNLEIDENILVSCRVCLKKNRKMKDLFDEAKEIVNKIEFCTGILLKDDSELPKNICNICIRNLTVAHKFKTRCILSERTLQNLLDVEININSNIKDLENCKIELKTEDLYEEASNCGSVNGINNVKTIKTELNENNLLTVESERESPKAKKTPNKRGPYKKVGPKRLKKLKFRKLACEPCGLKFTDKRQSDDHKLQHKEEPWICEICGKSFSHRSSLHSHVSSHTRMFSCEHCDYGTGNKFDLIKHMQIHLGLKRFKCSECPAVYRTSSSMRDHVKRTHLQLRPHACHLCDRTFYDRTKLNRHVDSHFDLKRFECDICQACFSRRWYWKKHLEKQHDVVVPPKRPGRQRTTEYSIDITENIK
ncbi:unnamed protein product [Danaus chrysippus]|uniref:(African queen) hypothetical protein n=1 Tax=Danaus chrysippus TaxID=151541 RepID=A0A8J2QZG9_9NEOP|nr:unnamed protein product [Danaus chrysippus]